MPYFALYAAANASYCSIDSEVSTGYCGTLTTNEAVSYFGFPVQMSIPVNTS